MARLTEMAENQIYGQLDAIGAGGAARWLVDKARSMVPAMWQGDDYAPEQWAEWRQSLETDPETAYQYQQWESRAKQILPSRIQEYQDFILKSGMQLPANPHKNMDQARNVMARLTGQPFDPADKEAAAYVNGFLRYLRDRGPGGPLADDASVTEAQKAEWDSDPNWRASLNSNYRLNEVGQKNLATARDYHVLRAFQTDEHRPEFAKGGVISPIQSAIGGMFDTTGMTSEQMFQAAAPSPKAALRNTLMWDDYYQQRMQQQPGYWNDMFGGGVLPQFSATTPQGLDTKTSQGDSWTGRWSNWLGAPLFFPDVPNEQLRDNYVQYMNRMNRVTPIRNAAPNSPQAMQADNLLAAGNKMNWENQRQISTYTPHAIHSLNKLTGIDMKAFYPPAAVNDALMVPHQILGDPQNLAMTLPMAGLGLLKGGVSGAARAVASNVSDIGPEMGYSTSISLGNNPQDVVGYLSKPDPGMPLRTKQDKVPDPDNEQEYYSALNQWQSDRKNTLQQMGDWLKTDEQAGKQPQGTSLINTLRSFLNR